MTTSMPTVLEGTSIATHQQNRAEANELRQARLREAELSAALEARQTVPEAKRWCLTDLAAAAGGLAIGLAADLAADRDIVVLGLAAGFAGALLVLTTPIVSSYTRRATAASITVRVGLVLLASGGVYGLADALGSLVPVVPVLLAVVMGAAIVGPRLSLARALFHHEDDVRRLHALRRTIAVLAGKEAREDTPALPVPRLDAPQQPEESVHGPN